MNTVSVNENPFGRKLVLACLLPILLVNIVAFMVPVLNLAAMSFRAASSTGSLEEGITVSTWLGLFGDGYYWSMVGRTVWFGILITIITLLLSYPLALFVSRREGSLKAFLVVVCISPLLISAVVRTYGWMVILGDQGVLPSLIRASGFTPPRLINNETGVIIGMVEILMPYMILSLLSGFGKLDATLEQAAGTLGARPFTVFRRVVLPLSLPGILLGCLLCFVLAVSSFITPKMLAGGRVSLLATEIYDQAIVTLNWPLAACLSVLILVVFGAALVLYGRLSKIVE
ncbi:polyamine ABC transporter permease [Azorhizobium oxalatiphilum]|uniref:Polyamine ABC transporter permease n=1 Tax=Azorhizobium oxalatiphilum TaxID=980631 RepID=A0A917F4V0_9HYPH|nr:ABC transporter permease [Azorhizobium oxalatiphilum]GGF50507.1 polyamine ABC transporter permease [Azorhizobium oxalatiphilum]